MPGLFITFEGVEGAGKTSHIRRLAEELNGRGCSVIVTREPGGHPLGEEIRRLLLSFAQPPTARAELLLFLAARAQLTEIVIRPHLAADGVVICDRFIDSTAAYQGHARAPQVTGGDARSSIEDLVVEKWIERVRELNEIATGGLKPDVTILLDLDPEVGLSRQSDHNRMEAEDMDFHRRVRDGYLAEAEREPGRFRVIDSSRPLEAVYADIVDAVEALLTGDHP